jgi:hypothetical protein
MTNNNDDDKKGVNAFDNMFVGARFKTDEELVQIGTDILMSFRALKMSPRQTLQILWSITDSLYSGWVYFTGDRDAASEHLRNYYALTKTSIETVRRGGVGSPSTSK